jgi:hypothetical protein
MRPISGISAVLLSPKNKKQHDVVYLHSRQFISHGVMDFITQAEIMWYIAVNLFEHSSIEPGNWVKAPGSVTFTGLHC